jgi:hypothetical protein
MNMDANKIVLYASVAGEVVKIASGTYDRIKAAFASDPSIEVDNAQLDRVNAEYTARIAEARREAGLDT